MTHGVKAMAIRASDVRVFSSYLAFSNPNTMDAARTLDLSGTTRVQARNATVAGASSFSCVSDSII